MANTTTDPNRPQIPTLILIGIWLALGYWVMEAYFDSLLVENVSFAMRLFPSDKHELWMRSLTSLLFIGFGLYSHKVNKRIRSTQTMNVDAAWLLKNALSKTIRGNFPVCVSCKNICNQEGEWVTPVMFITAQTEAEFTRSMCKECLIQHPPDEAGGEEQKN